MGHAGLHGARRHQHLGHENNVVAELDAHDGHSGNQAIVQNGVGVEPVVQRLLGQPVHLDVLADNQVIGDVVHDGG